MAPITMIDIVNTAFTIVACIIDAVCLLAVFYIDARYKKRFEHWEATLHKVREDLDEMAAHTDEVARSAKKVAKTVEQKL